MENKNISIRGARVNNLNNVNVDVPLSKFTVITGVSGSGKSSLAFDTLYAEGQRRYVESLSAYARQFLGRMSKPECDYIKGLPPAIAIEQKVTTRNPRSTVGTSTEIYDYMRMLFARIGKTISPVSGAEVKRHTTDDAADTVMSYPQGTRLAVLAPIRVAEGRTFAEQLDIYSKEGFSRLEHNGSFEDIPDVKVAAEKSKKIKASDYNLVIDRLSVSDNADERTRLADSIDTAMFEGHDECIVKVFTADGIKEHSFSTRFSVDGIDFPIPDDSMFNFNSPAGACERCEGFGNVLGISEDLVIPDKSLSVYQDAVQCFRGEKMRLWKDRLIMVAGSNNFPIHKPYLELTDSEKDFLWHGGPGWMGIDGFFKDIESQSHKIQYRVMLSRYRGKTRCPECHGNRLKKWASYVKIAGKNISELSAMQACELLPFFENLQLDDNDRLIGDRLITEITSRLRFLNEVGLGYLTLNRPSNTLSGGESQRINLATSLGSALVGSLYVLDEPSIGLHSRDTDRLIGVLRNLRQIGNSVVVVEHDEDIMRNADYIIDIGKDAGSHGGNIVYSGNYEDIFSDSIPDGESYTIDYLRGHLEIPVPDSRRRWKKRIEIKGAAENNLKNIDVTVPLGVMTVVTGVSGSGKSTLVREILYKALRRIFSESSELPGSFHAIEGDISALKSIEFVDQNPIGASSRSNPATYLKAFDEIRRLFAEQPLAKQLGFTPAFFSFNAEGGRCEECKGEGTVTIPMQFMADITIKCEACNGQRYKRDVLEVRYRGKSIYDMLEMTVAEAIEFMSQQKGSLETKIIKRLQPLMDVGLGYIKLGQSSSTLSGGENQRVKLAYYLSQDAGALKPTMFIFDEPTTGLHFADISTLMTSLNRLVDRGHTVVIIEHNLDVIKCADYIIDIGPEGGDEGGRIVACGTPEQVAATAGSYTGKYLAPKLETKK